MGNGKWGMVLVEVGAGPRPALVVLWPRDLAGGPSPARVGEANRAHRPVGTQRVGARHAVPLQLPDFAKRPFVDTHRTLRIANGEEQRMANSEWRMVKETANGE
jgi:hypothetical protein